MKLTRMAHLLKTLQSVQRRDKKQDHTHFNMSLWANDTKDRCGTVACALGWEATTLYAHNRGLRLVEDRYDGDVVPKFGSAEGVEAGAEYFDIEYDQASKLFNPWNYPDQYNIKIGEVIAKVKKLLRGQKL